MSPEAAPAFVRGKPVPDTAQKDAGASARESSGRVSSGTDSRSAAVVATSASADIGGDAVRQPSVVANASGMAQTSLNAPFAAASNGSSSALGANSAAVATFESAGQQADQPATAESLLFEQGAAEVAAAVSALRPLPPLARTGLAAGSSVAMLLSTRLKDLEADRSAVHAQLEDLHAKYGGALAALARHVDGVQKSVNAVRNMTFGIKYSLTVDDLVDALTLARGSQAALEARLEAETLLGARAIAALEARVAAAARSSEVSAVACGICALLSLASIVIGMCPKHDARERARGSVATPHPAVVMPSAAAAATPTEEAKKPSAATAPAEAAPAVPPRSQMLPAASSQA